MKTLSSTEAKAKFNAVLAEVAATGEPVTITSHGEAVAVLQPAKARARRFGRLAGVVAIPEDFDAPMTEDELRQWEGAQGESAQGEGAQGESAQGEGAQ